MKKTFYKISYYYVDCNSSSFRNCGIDYYNYMNFLSTITSKSILYDTSNCFDIISEVINCNKPIIISHKYSYIGITKDNIKTYYHGDFFFETKEEMKECLQYFQKIDKLLKLNKNVS